MAEDFVSGYFGGIAGLLIGHPLDTVKVNLQSSMSTYKGPLDCFRQLTANEKVIGLYKGVSSPLMGAAFLNAILFGVNGLTRCYLPKKIENTYGGYFLCGMTAGGFQTIVTCPTELIKIRMQVHDYSIKGTDQSKFTMSNMAREIYHKNGLRAFYRGMVPTLMRDIPGFGVYFTTFEFLNNQFDRLVVDKSNQAHAIQILFCGGMAGVVSWLPSYYFDTVKTRIQEADLGSKKVSVFDVHQSIYQRNGMKGFYRGLGTALLRAFPVNAATFGGATLTIKIFQQF